MSRDLYPSAWNSITYKIRKRDNYTCVDCGKREKSGRCKFYVHHIDKNPHNIDPLNLITLCTVCHGKRHTKKLQGNYNPVTTSSKELQVVTKILL